MQLRPYQLEAARVICQSVVDNKGLTFTVEIARQGGKNELSAHLELLLLTMFMAGGGTAVKCSPTFKPQTVISMQRLKERLDEYGYSGIWRTELGYIIRLGGARQVFLSADLQASVVGHTADILLEIDESQDVSKDKFTKDFRPMASSTNTTTVLYGTTWDDTTLLEEMKQANLELEKQDGLKRHFRYDWQEVGKYNPSYLSFVEAERDRLGEDHPLFLTQYALKPLRGGGGFLSRVQVGLTTGSHPRLRSPDAGRTYVAGIDLAGQEEQLDDLMLTRPSRDATVITIAELTHSGQPPQPALKVVEHYAWIGEKHTAALPHITELLKTWRVTRAVVDATGMGEPIAAYLKQALGSRVQPFVFTQKSKSELAFELLAFVNSGRLKLYQVDGSSDYQELIRQMERAKSVYRPNQTLNFYVDPSEGHDDYLISLALTVWAARGSQPRIATGSKPQKASDRPARLTGEI